MQFDVQSLRQELHRHPEVGLQNPQTQQRILRALDGLPLEITLGKEVTSITAVLRGRAKDGRRVVLLRADMDGLPATEQTSLPYRSTNGAMHACGHDLHMAMLVGAAHELSARAGELAGDVVFMFQTGEEGLDGGAAMIREGVLDAAGRRVDAAYAIHVWSSLEPLGTFCTKVGTMMSASDSIDVTVIGKGGHGAAPHLSKDPVLPMAEMLVALQVMLGRNTDAFEPAIISPGLVRAGEGMNTVIPETATFSATVRTFSPQTQELVLSQAERVVRGVAAAHGVEVDFTVKHIYPVTYNEADCTTFAQSVIDELFPGRHARWDRALTASEDFSRILAEVPGTFIGLSAAPAGVDPLTAPFNHSAHAVFDDSVLGDGVRLLTELAVRDLMR